jgi:hypothetical protein
MLGDATRFLSATLKQTTGGMTVLQRPTVLLVGRMLDSPDARSTAHDQSSFSLKVRMWAQPSDDISCSARAIDAAELRVLRGIASVADLHQSFLRALK